MIPVETINFQDETCWGFTADGYLLIKQTDSNGEVSAIALNRQTVQALSASIARLSMQPAEWDRGVKEAIEKSKKEPGQ